MPWKFGPKLNIILAIAIKSHVLYEQYVIIVFFIAYNLCIVHYNYHDADNQYSFGHEHVNSSWTN